MFPFHEKVSSSRISKNGIAMQKGLQDYFRKKKNKTKKTTQQNQKTHMQTKQNKTKKPAS